MKGSVLDFDVSMSSGLIAGDDGARYEFAGIEWKGQGLPIPGTRVDFVGSANTATGVYRDATTSPANTVDAALGRSRIVAALLALFLGTIGIHRFYLGQTKQGIYYILAVVLTFGIGALVTAILGLIEAIQFLSMSDAEFQRRYPPTAG
jgi:TM2 domain-containing membrane protein YozV